MADKPNTAEPAKPRRRWFQFRLRTLLIGVMLLSGVCVYVANDARIVYDRALERRWLEQHGAQFMWDDDAFFSELPILKPQRDRPLPWLRRLLGDRAVATIFVSDSSGLMERARRSFPESFVTTPIHLPD